MATLFLRIEVVLLNGFDEEIFGGLRIGPERLVFLIG
jgi:hypothetical protein